ncbi:MAG: YkgJ family cysteine cluster protein [Thermodesulfobacteriota bacterium]
MKYKKIKKISDIDNTALWTKYEKSLCSECVSTCCTLIVEVSAEDLERLGFIEKDEALISLKKIIKELKSSQIIKRYNFKSKKFVLEQKNGSDCIFLNKNRDCTVYENRPAVCRNHPEKAGSKIGFCPFIPKE